MFKYLIIVKKKYYKMTELKIEHVLMLIIVTFVLYYFMGRYSCGNGFSVGGVICDGN